MTSGAIARNFTRRRLRFASGLVLLSYVFTHLANHALGLVSLEAAESGRLWFIAFWRSAPGTVALYGALLTHVGLALAALYERRTLRMPALELVRLALGFSIPFLLASHFAATRLAYALYAQDDPYARVAWGIWMADGGLRQLGLMLVAWSHGCLGVHFAFRYRAAYRRLQPLLIAAATLLPALAYLGVVSMAREIAPRTREFASLNLLTAAQRAQLSGIASGLMITVAMLIIAVLAARALRDWREKRAGGVLALTYPGRVVRVPRGFSVLEASRENGIPHLSLCGGRARCSTCRVQVAGPAQNLPPAGEDERRTLARIGAGPDVRLACQLRPLGDIAVTPLLPAGALPALELEGLPSFERDVAILFIDLRRWTGLSEEHLPFDLVYVLNQYFTAVGDAVREAGGVPNQFIGDSVMAIFGLETAPDEACRQALAAAAGVERRMAELNERLRRDFGRALEFGMGIHAGRAAVGSVGYRDTRTLSAVGDAVNTASRLQELTKTYGVRLVISERVARAARLDTSGWQSHRISIRGRSAPLGIYAAGEATTPRAASS